MEDYMMTVFLYIFAICYVLGIAIWISKAAAKRGAIKVRGTIVDIYPRYRGADYTAKVTVDGTQLTHTFYKRTWFGGYNLGTSLSFFVIQTSGGYKLKQVSNYYSFVYLLFAMPFLVMFAMIFETN